MPLMSNLYHTLSEAVEQHGLLVRGGFAPGAADGVPEIRPGVPTKSVVMIGNGGRDMWAAFQHHRRNEPSPLDAWTKRTIEPIAARASAIAVYPYDAPPLPFQWWARRASGVTVSPLGLLIDPEYGLWHALRAALLFAEVIEMPPILEAVSPCASCATKPCLTACPIGAFTQNGFDYVGCRTYLGTAAGRPCLANGCRARAACPVGASHQYGIEQLKFHQRSFSGIDVDH
jgi:epoxyqueuosine reductase QueG